MTDDKEVHVLGPPAESAEDTDVELDAELEDVYLTLTGAFSPQDVFGQRDIAGGETADNFLKRVKAEYRRLKDICDPSQYEFPEDIEAAEEALHILNDLAKRAREEIAAGTYGTTGIAVNRDFDRSLSLCTLGRTFYYERTPIAEGTDSVLYPCYELREDGSVRFLVLKVARGIPQNPSLELEAFVLRRIRAYKSIPQRRHFPSVQAELKLANGKLALIESRFAGITLEEVLKDPLHRGGVDQKHAMWMLGKGLSALGLAHACGVVHGGLTPQHIMCRTDHGLLICGWGGSVYDPAETRKKLTRDFGKFAAPEIKRRRLPGPWTDLYELGLCIIWALGGDPETKEIPEEVDEPLARILRLLVTEDERERPFSAWQFFEQERQPALTELREHHGWPRDFFPFKLTGF